MGTRYPLETFDTTSFGDRTECAAASGEPRPQRGKEYR